MASNGTSTLSVASKTAVIRVLVAAMGDGSRSVQEAAASALCEIARQNSGAVLDCCATSLRAGKRIANYRAGLLLIMAYTVREMGEDQITTAFMRTISKLGTDELSSNKEVNVEWNRAASSLLVAVGSRSPDVLMDEIFNQLAGTAIPVVALVQTLAEFATSYSLQFAPHLKNILSRVLPVLGSVKDIHKKIFAEGFTCWCEAMTQFYEVCSSTSTPDVDMQAMLHSAFELFLDSWITFRVTEVRLATAKALGEMASLIGRPQLRAALPRLLPSLMAVCSYKKGQHNLAATSSLQNVLVAVLVNDGGSDMVDFMALASILNRLLPRAYLAVKKENSIVSSSQLKNLNDVVRCSLTIGMAYPGDFFDLLSHKLRSQETVVQLGALSLFKHLLPRLSEPWLPRRAELAGALRDFLSKQDLRMRIAVAEVVISMVSSGFLDRESSEEYIEFLVKQCAIPVIAGRPILNDHGAVENGRARALPDADTNKETRFCVSTLVLRDVCKKGLRLLAATVTGAEVLLWPFLLKMLMPLQYTGAFAVVCTCISDILRHMLARDGIVSVDYITYPSIPQPEELLARLLVLLQNPRAEEQLVSQILTILNYLGSIFPTAVVLLWEEKVPKMRAYISDIDKDSWTQNIWEDMILQLLSELLDVVHDPDWIMSFGTALASHYNLYVDDNQHCALLHRCMGTILQKVDDKNYVQQMISLMYKRADNADETNRLGLAMAMGLVASAHLDTVLEKLRRLCHVHILKQIFYRLLSYSAKHQSPRELLNVVVALAQMYGYIASYAPLRAIEARIDTLVVELEHLRCSYSAFAVSTFPKNARGTFKLPGSNMRVQAVRQAIISAIKFLGQAVMKAANHGIAFPLKRRDVMLDFVISLMSANDNDSLDLNLLRTQEMAINVCSTLVSVEPRLTTEMRDHVLQAIFGLLAQPETSPVTKTLFSKLNTLMCMILQTSGEDGKSRAIHLQHLLKRLDQYISSTIECQRERACGMVLALLCQFRLLFVAGNCSFNCTGDCMHVQLNLDGGHTASAAPALLPPRELLKLGERVMAYIPRCADTSPVIRKIAAQALHMLFKIAVLLDETVELQTQEDRVASGTALSALQDLIEATKWEHEGWKNILRDIVNAVGGLLSPLEVVAALTGCRSPICDKTLRSGQGAIAATQLMSMRGSQLQEEDVSRITRALLSAAAAEYDRRQEIFVAICSLAEHSLAKVVFNEVITVAETELVKEESLKKGWPVQGAILAISHHEVLSLLFLEHVVGILQQERVFSHSVPDKSDALEHLTLQSQLPHAATLVIGGIFRGANDVVKEAVDICYPQLLCSLLFRIGSIQWVVRMDIQPLRDFISTFQYFSETIRAEEMGKVLYDDGERRLSGERWTEAIEEIASCSARIRPQWVDRMCTLLCPALNRSQDSQRAAAAAALCQLVQHSEDRDTVVDSVMRALSAHTADESSKVRSLCVKGLIQMPLQERTKYASELLTVIAPLMGDTEEEVVYAAVHGLSSVLDVAAEDVVGPMILDLSVQLRTLHVHQLERIRAATFQALGKLSRFATGVHMQTFMEQLHATLPQLVFHVNDEAPSVCQACKNTLRILSPLLQAQDVRALVNVRTFDFGRGLEYDDFMKEFVRHLTIQFRDKVDKFVTSAVQAFDSPWPLIQANTSSFVGFLLSEVKDTMISEKYLPQVTSILMKKTATSPSALVRAKSTLALSMLISEMEGP